MEILDTKSKWGYTLLEIIVVLALFAIILSIAIPSTQIISHVREREELKTFRRDILGARNSAIVENCFYIFSLDEENNGYIIKKLSGASVIQEKVKSVTFKNGIVLRKHHDKKDIKFNASGAPDMGNTFLLTNRKKETIKVSITPVTGSVSLEIIK